MHSTNLLKNLIKQKKKEIGHEIKEIRNLYGKYLEDSSYSDLDKSFFPSSTAKNALNFIKDKEEYDLITKAFSENSIFQKEIVDFYKLIYIVIDDEEINNVSQINFNYVKAVYEKIQSKEFSNLSKYINFRNIPCQICSENHPNKVRQASHFEKR